MRGEESPTLLSEWGPFPPADSGRVMGWSGGSPASRRPKRNAAPSASSAPPPLTAGRDPAIVAVPQMAQAFSRPVLPQLPWAGQRDAWVCVSLRG